MAPLAAVAPDSSQPDVDLTVGFDDLFMMLIVFTGVCLAVLVTFAAAALWASRLEDAEQVDHEHPAGGITGPRGPAAPGLPRNHPAVAPAGNSVRTFAPPAPAAPSARSYRTVPLARAVVRRLASAPPAVPSPRGHRTVPLARAVVRRLASPAPAAPSPRGYTVPLPRHVLEALKAYTKQFSADPHAAGHR
jgi:hypothetical protein